MSGILPFAFPRLTSFVRKLMMGLAAALIVQLVLGLAGIPAFELLALHLPNLGLATLWQLLTQVAAQPPEPGSVVSLLISLVFIWWIVAPFEASYGSRRTWQLCLVGTLASSLAGLMTGLALPSSEALLHGAAPITHASIAALATTLRGGRLSLFGMVSMTSRQLLLLLVGFDLVMFLARSNVMGPSRAAIYLAASLAPIAAGVLFVRWMQRPRSRRRPGSSGRRKAPFQVLRGGGQRDSNPDRSDDRPRWLN